VLALARRSVLFVPFVSIAVAKSLVLLAMYFFWHPVLAGFMVPTLRSLGGEEVLHFPAHVRNFPEMFQIAEVLLLVLFGFAMTSWTVFLIADTLEGRRRQFVTYAGEVAVLTPAIVIIALCFAGGTVGIPMGLDWAAGEFEKRPKIQFLLSSGALAAGFVTTVILGYSLFFLRSAKGGAFAALRASFSYAREHLTLTSLVVLTVFVPEKILENLAFDSGSLVSNLREGWVPGFLFLGVLLEVVTSFFLFGALTSKGLDRTRM
jgi:hypothetical protein